MITQSPTLVVIRGNSSSGKTTTAREVRARYGRGCALIEQDHMRRIVLREHDTSSIDVAAPAVIAATATAALEHGFHVIVEGMMIAARYQQALLGLIRAHAGPAHVFYLDVSLDETIRRHQGKGLEHVTADHLRDWYTAHDVLGVSGEVVISEDSSQEQTVAAILHTSGLSKSPPFSACPNRCAYCTARSASAS